jgi:hypothetical protein
MSKEYMELTDEQKAVFEEAIRLLEPYDKEIVSYDFFYFREKNEEGDTIGEEVCVKKKCLKAQTASIRKTLGKGKHIYYERIQEWGDSDRIKVCCECGCPFHTSLTWVEDDFSNHVENTRSLEEITESCNAFQLIVIFSSMPSSDHAISPYSIRTDYENSKKEQDDFLNEVLDYAKHIICTIKNV